MRVLLMSCTAAFVFSLLLSGCGGANGGPTESLSQMSADSLDIWVESDGRTLPVYRVDGRHFLLGERGRSYSIWVANRSDRRMEVVLSVDGRDVVSGREADYRENRGYVLFPGEEIEVKGFRKSLSAVAEFEFTSVDDSYASRMGDGGNVGVIGAAVFLEDEPYDPQPLRMKDRPIPVDEDRPARRESKSAPRAGASYSAAPEMEESAGIGTGYGGEVGSEAEVVPFKRASDRPDEVAALYYDDRAGLEAAGVVFEDREPDDDRCSGPNPFPGVECRDDDDPKPLRQL